MDICENMVYGGYSDWRLPGMQEFLSLVRSVRGYSIPDPYAFPMADYGYLWASTVYALDATGHGVVDFSGLYVQYRDSMMLSYAVSCVRGASRESAEGLPTPFAVSGAAGQQVVSDRLTGLIWQKDYPALTKNWPDALQYCQNLEYDSYSDWRLPDQNELLSLVAFDQANPASLFPDMPGLEFWSSSSSGPVSAATVSFGTAGLGERDMADGYYMRCVRSDRKRTCDDGDACTYGESVGTDGTCQGGISYTCNGHGACNGNYLCTCEDGYSGVFCNE